MTLEGLLGAILGTITSAGLPSSRRIVTVSKVSADTPPYLVIVYVLEVVNPLLGFSSQCPAWLQGLIRRA